MFSMTKIKAVNGAGKVFYANHLAANDYYSEKEKVVGIWCGSLAFDFDLLGKRVDTETFSLFQRNINPFTGAKLTQRTVSSGVRFFDFQCAAPKSVSIMALFDRRLLEAHDQAVQEAMIELECLAAARVRKGDNVRTNNLEMTGKIVYASFRHDASRALDPQVHTHNVVVNVTRDSAGKYKALESVEMCRAIRYAGKVYHNELAKRCRELGYEMVNRRDEKGNITWQDIAGVSEELMEKFSKRRLQIEAEETKFIEEHGRKPTLSENNFIAVTTRNSKMKHIERSEVKKLQFGEMSDAEYQQLRQLYFKARRGSGMYISGDIDRAKTMLEEALPLVFERESVVKLDKVLAEALNQNLGEVDLETLKNAVKEVSELRDLGGLKVNPWVSPEKVIEQELFAIKSVEERKDLFKEIAPDFEPFPGQETRKTQGELIHKMLCNKDQFNLFRGVAGAGKTSALQELCRGLQSGGVNSIYVIAPTNSATDVLKQEGFEESQTVASFLLSEKKPAEGSYVIIDESGLNSLREGVEIVKVARANNYRVLFVGDARQHTAVESGDFFRLLEDHSTIAKFSLTEIHRQQNEEYRRGISDCALGNFEAAFERFDRNGFIHEGKSKYLQEAAESYMKFTDNGEFIDRAILVAPTHDEGDRLTAAVREKLKSSGSVASTGRQAEVFRSWSKPKVWIKNVRNYAPGTTIAFIRNMKDIGNAGEVAKVERVEGDFIYLDSGKCLRPKAAADFIEVGELRKIELCRGDLIQFNVNLRDKKIYNGNIAQITDDPRKVMMLYSDGTPRELIDLPEDYATFKYGWVTTSHKSQGRTAENVVVAAQALDRKVFYVALSRGRKNMALHCPEKEFLKQQLNFRIGDRTSVHDLLAEGQISAERMLPLSEDAQRRKAETLPDEKYKSVIERTRLFMEQIKQTTAKVWERAKQIAARRSRRAKYGYGPISENTIWEMDQERAIALAKEEALAREKQRQAEEKPRKPLSKWQETMAWLADIGNGKNPPEPKPQSASKPAKPQMAMPPFTFKSSVLKIGKPAEPSAPRKKNSMRKALDFLAQESAKIQAEEAAEKARQEQLAAEKAAAELEEIAREETLRLEAEQQAREKIARERAEQNRREQQEREERERNKKKFRGMDI